ncbi:MFS transporter [Sphingomonas sabuli]|uniref:Alpha-ketoglutarate permease n=1 Tax=Sphingomonas sabuli TaxID=2764186 RepID=A0A7G9L4C4_9SPHN|nr:MFS transporter [Sphingomonas sabuli]QNM83473.1 MFS transporter [Sphingomonas sabuli]
MAATNTRRLKNIVGGSAGNLVEWFDWYVYAAFAIYFAETFFPAEDPTVELLQAAAVFAVGFLMRPIGAWAMGIYADHRGRKAGLSLSVTLMCTGSLLIAIAPTYEQAGVLAPAVLLVARMIQGISLGGEYGSSATYLSEMAGRDRRGLWSSFQYVTIIGGQLTALAFLVILQSVLTEAELTEWGWRLAFGMGGVLAVVVFVIRRGLDETLSYANVAGQVDRPKSSSRNLFKEHPREALLVIALTAGGTAAFYAYTIYMQKFLINTSGFDKVTASRIMTAGLFCMMLVQPLAGAISDRVGRKPMMIFFGASATVFTYPLFVALESARSVPVAFMLVMASLVMVTGYTSINAVIKAELFPAHIRALGVALPYALANTVFGGTAEYVALWLKSIGHERWFYIYISVLAACSLVAYVTMRETKTSSRILED